MVAVCCDTTDRISTAAAAAAAGDTKNKNYVSVGLRTTSRQISFEFSF
jgi:hypothetical protein